MNLVCLASLMQLYVVEGLAWYIAMDKEVKPWRKPLREQQAHAVRKEPWKPNNVSSTQWKNMVNSDIMNKSRDTKFDLNPEGELIDKENSMDDTEEDLSDSKPLNKMSLQVTEPTTPQQNVTKGNRSRYPATEGCPKKQYIKN